MFLYGCLAIGFPLQVLRSQNSFYVLPGLTSIPKFEEQQSGSWQQTIEQLAETLYPKLGPKRGSATENLYRSALLACPWDHPYIMSAHFWTFF